ncbi:DUF4397 domain-containing protein [Nocardioides sp.]|uniref:DUF4397 domain-containing protein n=1 Tax=Nocardioides sp. TaxID=35761 RepID=UPI002727C35E|nr:DUF4397 domain-containing protein [Nocardioides sp.]MDO9458375.1 hypothetical protein [Nocardioides sp.]
MIRRLLLTALSAACVLVAAPVGAHAAPVVGQRAPATGQVQLIQGVPGVTASVRVDGKEVGTGARVGSVMPLDLAPGTHEVAFTDSEGTAASVSVKVGRGQSSDVVYHLPASLGGEPVVSTYRTPTKAIGPGKARVLIAHTATLAPADVEVDGKTIFSDIANGEFAEAEVPAGTLSVSLIPSQGAGKPVLGPLDVTLKPSTVTMVYAVGRPDDGTMQVITRTAKISRDGTVVPDAIDTGSAGLAADVTVSPFASEPKAVPAQPDGRTSWPWVALAGALVVALGAAGRRLTGQARATRLLNSH